LASKIVLLRGFKAMRGGFVGAFDPSGLSAIMCAALHRACAEKAIAVRGIFVVVAVTVVTRPTSERVGAGGVEALDVRRQACDMGICGAHGFGASYTGTDFFDPKAPSPLVKASGLSSFWLSLAHSVIN
jgi:hypothetical protein